MEPDDFTEDTLAPAGAAVPDMPIADDAIASDEHAGRGGSYIFDPVSNTRTRVGGTEEVKPAEEKSNA
jgi:hypothetical protein